VIDVSNPANPAIISQTLAPGDGYGIWVSEPYGHAYAADGWTGLHVYDISDPVHPALDTTLFGASTAYDVKVQDSLVFLADGWAGMKVISLSDPASPTQIGSLDTTGWVLDCQAVGVKDSFAYLRWDATGAFASVDVSDPRHPTIAGRATPLSNWVRGIVVRDSLAYVVKDYKFETYNIAKPRNLRLVGHCDLPDDAFGLCMKDSLAYVANQYAGLTILNVADPSGPFIVGSLSLSSWANGVSVKDTIAYVATVERGVRVISVSNPSVPVEIASYMSVDLRDICSSGRFAYVGGNNLFVLDISDPLHPVEIGHYDTPDWVQRVRVDSAFIYAACFGAGLGIFQNVPNGLKETECHGMPSPMTIRPNPVLGRATLIAGIAGLGGSCISILDIQGRRVASSRWPCAITGPETELDLSRLSAGVYFVSIRNRSEQLVCRLVKADRR
jgi:hypothetical protein